MNTPEHSTRTATLPFSDTLLADGASLRPVTAITLADGRIRSVDTGSESPPQPEPDAPGTRILTPGLIDMHIHGVGLAALENGPDAFPEMSRLLPRFGVTRLFPTLVPGTADGPRGFVNRMAALSAAMDNLPGARMPGFHVEGPFVARGGAACATLPGDVGLLDEIISASGNRVRILSLAPDVPNILPVIERALAAGIVVFVTHTEADVETTQAAIEAGARHATHFYDVFYAPPVTDPGVRPAGAVEAFLADPRCSVDFIADGVHVHPVAIQAALRAKGTAGVGLVSDGNVGAGLPAGIYKTPWGYPIEVGERGGARIADPKHRGFGGLAGSSLTLDQGVRNLCRWLKMPFAQVIPMASDVPARLTRQNAGRIAPGHDADLVLWERDGDAGWFPVKTWIQGVPQDEPAPRP